MPYRKLKRQALGDEKLEVEDVGRLELGDPSHVVLDPDP